MVTCTHLHAQSPGSLVLVAGATGGVGQLVTAKLIEVTHLLTDSVWPDILIMQRGYRVRALTRGTKGSIFGDVDAKKLEVQAAVPRGAVI